MSILSFFARRFIAGERIEHAVRAIKELKTNGVTATLDVLGENVKSQEEATQKADNYIQALEVIDKEKLDSHVSIKLTQMGLDVSDGFCYDNVSRIFQKASALNNFVRVDMEGSDYTQRTLDLVFRWHQRFPNMGVVIQAMLLRSEDDIKELNRRQIRVRLCKGAYREPKQIALQDRRKIRKSFITMTQLLLKGGDYPAIGTHDDKLIEATKEFAQKEGIGKDRYEFQMLYGIRRGLQLRLAQEGYNVRVYVPYGTHWLPYYLRRLREKRENMLFFVTNFFRD
jgi:proline dehydrogenase